MDTSNTSSVATPRYHGGDKLILGTVLAVVTFWLFAQTTLHVAAAMRNDLQIAEGVSNIAVSIRRCSPECLLSSRVGWQTDWAREADQHRCRPQHLRFAADCPLACWNRGVLDGWAHCPGHLGSLHHAGDARSNESYFDGKERQRALSFWSIGSWGGSGLSSFFGGFVASTIGWR